MAASSGTPAALTPTQPPAALTPNWRSAGSAPSESLADLPCSGTLSSTCLTSDRVTLDPVAPTVVGADRVAPELMVQLALVLDAGAGGLSGVDSEAALRVVEAVEAVKAWADSVSVAATAAMVTEFETDFVHLAPERPSRWGWTRFVRTCRSAAAREIQVATGLPITQCQRRVWLATCEPERTGVVREAMRLGRVSFARALALTEATAELDAFTAAAIATRVLRPLSGPDGVPLPAMAPLSQATFTARLHTQPVLAHGLTGQSEAGVGQVPGWGALGAQQTRTLALQAGSIWIRIVTDPLTGRAIEATAGTYRVPAAMTQQVNTRDGTCRAPGCEIPTANTDLDHSI